MSVSMIAPESERKKSHQEAITDICHGDADIEVKRLLFNSMELFHGELIPYDHGCFFHIISVISLHL